MLHIEEDFNGLLSVSHSNRLALKNRAQRGNALLAVQEEALRRKHISSLSDRQITCWRLLIGLPDQDGTRRIAAVEGVKQISYSCGRPDIGSLHFWESQFTTRDHAH